MIVGRKRENEYMGVIIAKKLSERRMVFQFRRARRTQNHEKDSCATSLDGVDPCASSFMRARAPASSSSVKKFASLGVCGRKNIVRIPKGIVIPPSTKKMKG